jgi:hypothetical protein
LHRRLHAVCPWGNHEVKADKIFCGVDLGSHGALAFTCRSVRPIARQNDDARDPTSSYRASGIRFCGGGLHPGPDLLDGTWWTYHVRLQHVSSRLRQRQTCISRPSPPAVVDHPHQQRQHSTTILKRPKTTSTLPPRYLEHSPEHGREE